MLPDYFLVRNDRVGMRGGGVACYIHTSLCFKLLAVSAQEFSNAPEYLIGEIRNGQDRTILYATVYRRLKGFSFNNFVEILSGFSINYHNIIITGDLNCDLSKYNFDSNSLREFAHSQALHIVESGPTFHTNTSHSILDLFLVDCPSKVISFAKSTAPFIADHDLLELTYKFQTDSRPPLTIARRDLKHFVEADYLTSLSSSLSQLNLASISSLSSTDHFDKLISNFSSAISNTFDSHAPTILWTVKRSSAPWLTDELRSKIKNRNRLYNRARRSGDLLSMLIYRNFRNSLSLELRYARDHFFSHRISSSSDPAKIWKELSFLSLS